jgi:hypothetical protein
MISQTNIDFWITHNLNVCFTGEAGTGKTSIIIAAWKRHKLNFAYLSGATLDPWVDFIGVPKEHVDQESGQVYLDLVRPKAWANNEIEALFIDEYNRCFSGDTLIPLADGTTSKIKDLVGKDHFYVYSYDTKTKKVVIGKGHSARITKKKANLVKITLDNGETIKCTLDHPFLCRNGKYVNAKDLTIGTSLMPLYRCNVKRDTNIKQNLIGYEQVYNPETSSWIFTHRLADEYNVDNNIYIPTKLEGVRHHKDFNKLNNSPENIVRMTWRSHFNLHARNANIGGKVVHQLHPDLYERTIGNKAVKVKALANSLKSRQSISYKNKRSKISKRYMNEQGGKELQSINCKKSWEKGKFNNFDQKKSHEKRNDNMTIIFAKKQFNSNDFSEKEWQSCMGRHNKNWGYGVLSVDGITRHFGSFDAFKNVVKSNNHTIMSIEIIPDKEDVYDFTVDKYENFALSSGVFVHNCPKKVRNAVMELIQFKSINGKKFNNLRMVWVACNPDDSPNNDYDVEPLDPAQRDRFHIFVDIPYMPSLEYFCDKFGKNTGIIAVDWWKAIATDEIKRKVSPRRLDYALEILQKGGDLKYVLPESCNIKDLVNKLKFTPIAEKVAELYNKDKATAKVWIANENNYADSVNIILSKSNYTLYFLPLMPEEKIAMLISSNDTVSKLAVRLGMNDPQIAAIIEQIIKTGQNKAVVESLKQRWNDKKNSTVKSGGSSVKVTPNTSKDTFVSNMAVNNTFDSDLTWCEKDTINNPQSNTAEREKSLNRLHQRMPSSLSPTQIKRSFALIEDFVNHSSRVTKNKFDFLVPMCNHLTEQAELNGITFDMLKDEYNILMNYLLMQLKYCYIPV